MYLGNKYHVSGDIAADEADTVAALTVLIWEGGQMNKQDDCRLWLIPNKVKECVARLSE